MANYQKVVGTNVHQVLFTAINNIDGSGNISLGVTYDYLTRFNRVRWTFNTGTRNTATGNQIGDNFQVVSRGFSVSMEGYVAELTGVIGAVPAPLLDMLQRYTLFQLQVTRGGTQRTAYVSVANGFEEGDREVWTESLDFNRIEVGLPNPVDVSVS